MSEQTIGEVAGEVWRYIERSGGRVEVTTVRNQVRTREGISADHGMGWLAREGKLFFDGDHGSLQVGIRR